MKRTLKDTLDNLGPDVIEVFYFDKKGVKLDLTKYTESEFDSLEVIDIAVKTKKNKIGDRSLEIVNITVKKNIIQINYS